MAIEIFECRQERWIGCHWWGKANKNKKFYCQPRNQYAKCVVYVTRQIYFLSGKFRCLNVTNNVTCFHKAKSLSLIMNDWCNVRWNTKSRLRIVQWCLFPSHSPSLFTPTFAFSGFQEMMSVAGTLVVLIFTVVRVKAHGRLMDPPARNSMWRFGFPNPVNYNDNELFCGGFAGQLVMLIWLKNVDI